MGEGKELFPDDELHAWMESAANSEADQAAKIMREILVPACNAIAGIINEEVPPDEMSGPYMRYLALKAANAWKVIDFNLGNRSGTNARSGLEDLVGDITKREAEQ